MKTILSYGMGVESSALLAFWTEPGSRLDFDLAEDLIVITAHTGRAKLTFGPDRNQTQIMVAEGCDEELITRRSSLASRRPQTKTHR